MARMFSKGIMGFVVAMVAVMGTVLTGFAFSATETETTVTGYDYVTDVSGLFEHSEEPQFVDYNPAANWTGYHLQGLDYTSGITFTESKTANLYPIKQNPILLDTLSVNLRDITLDHANPPGTLNNPAASVMISDNIERPAANPGYIFWPYVTTVGSLIGQLNLNDDWETLTFTIPGDIVVVPQSSWILHRINANPSGGMPSYANYYILPFTENWGHAAKVTVDRSVNIVRLYDSAGLEFSSGSMENMTVAFSNTDQSEGTNYFVGQGRGDLQGTNLGYDLTVQSYMSPDAVYMDPSMGVAQEITSTYSSTYWSNGYINSRLDLIYSCPTASYRSSTEFTFNLCDINGNAKDNEAVRIEITKWPTYVDITINAQWRDENGQFKSYGSGIIGIGNWRNGMISLDLQAGTVTINPIITLNSFTDYKLSGDLRTIEMTGFPAGMTNEMEIETYNTNAGRLPMTIGIVNTSVFMNTYGAVMPDPHLEVSEYFPDITEGDYRLNLYSFALYGSSITINDQTFPVTAGQITVPIGKEERTLDLQNIYITWEGGRMYLTFANDNLTADLGETVSTEISMDGNWYFTTGLYQGFERLDKHLEFDFQRFVFDGNGAILMFMFLLIVGTAVAAKFNGMAALDLIVVFFAGALGFVLMTV